MAMIWTRLLLLLTVLAHAPSVYAVYRCQAVFSRVAPAAKGDPIESAKTLVSALEKRLSPDPASPSASHLDLRKNAKIVHEFDLNRALDILSNGSLSYAETISFRNSPDNRLKSDPELLGMELDLSLPLHRQMIPKYAYLVVNERPESAGFGTSLRMWGHSYGDVQAVLKDNVKERALFQYGNSGRFRSLSEPLYDPSKIYEPHLEAVVFGPLRWQDFDHLVIPPHVESRIQRDRDFITTKKPEDLVDDPGYYRYYFIAQKNVATYEVTHHQVPRMGIPVYGGRIEYHLKPLNESRPKTFNYEKNLNGVDPTAPRPELSQQQVQELIGPRTTFDWNSVVTHVFEKGLTLDQQIERYKEMQKRPDIREEVNVPPLMEK